MSVFRRREIYVVTTLITGFITIADYFVSNAVLSQVAKTLIDWTVYLAYFAIVLGLVNIIIFHANRIIHRQPQMILSTWLLIMMIGPTLLGIILGTKNEVYQLLFTNVYTPLGIAGYGIMTFFIASSAFRVLRVKSFDALLLVVALAFTVLYSAPIGSLVPYVPEIGNWIQSVPSNAGMRGIIIGFAIGTLGVGIRTLLGQERGYLPE
jgi:hypothetical protein